uniref:Uncharacterized protein n=1 Tax=Rhizophora mucronata TaxID=61149 RepID=A0A2P2N586_RHIMU
MILLDTHFWVLEKMFSFSINACMHNSLAKTKQHPCKGLED